MKARIVRYGFIGVVAVLIILCGMKFSNMYKDYQKLQFNQEQIDTQVSVLMSMLFSDLYYSDPIDLGETKEHADELSVFPVRVGGNDKRIFALGKPHCQLIAHLVGFLGGDLSGAERLPYLIGDHIIFLSAPGGKFVLPFGQHKFFVCGQRAALVAVDQLSPVRFVRILRVVRAAFQAGRNGFPLVFVQCNQTCCSHSESPPV